jgi:hypothetical protein
LRRARWWGLWTDAYGQVVLVGAAAAQVVGKMFKQVSILVFEALVCLRQDRRSNGGDLTTEPSHHAIYDRLFLAEIPED